MLFPTNAWRSRPRFFTFDNLTIISPLEEFSSHWLFFPLSSFRWFVRHPLLSFLSFLFSRHRDHRATKVEQTPSVGGRKGKSMSRWKAWGRVYHATSYGQFLFLTTGWYRYDLPPGRAVFLSDQHCRASASPWFFIHGEREGGGIIRLEPRPTENSHSSLFLRVFFRHALLLSFPPTYGYNVRRVNWTRSHRDCVRHLESSRPLNRLRSSVRGSFKLTHSYFLTKIVLYIYIDVFLLYYYFTRCSRLNYTLLRDSSINGSCKRVRTTRLFLPLIYFLPSNNIIILWWLVTVCRLINQS